MPQNEINGETMARVDAAVKDTMVAMTQAIKDHESQPYSTVASVILSCLKTVHDIEGYEAAAGLIKLVEVAFKEMIVTPENTKPH